MTLIKVNTFFSNIYNKAGVYEGITIWGAISKTLSKWFYIHMFPLKLDWYMPSAHSAHLLPTALYRWQFPRGTRQVEPCLKLKTNLILINLFFCLRMKSLILKIMKFKDIRDFFSIWLHRLLTIYKYFWIPYFC